MPLDRIRGSAEVRRLRLHETTIPRPGGRETWEWSDRAVNVQAAAFLGLLVMPVVLIHGALEPEVAGIVAAVLLGSRRSHVHFRHARLT
ncbi:hypothetical protein [Streptomyces sp. NPDC127098]|uniref:hypothetical protein n=1 Tax=Streptomyces sp. NPDC127098 TaxID=3347137 RepID=UPI003658CB5A